MKTWKDEKKKFHCKTSRFIKYKILKKLRKNYSKFVWLPGKIMNAIQSLSIQLLLIICSKPVKVMSKQCSGAISITLFCQIKLFKVINLLFVGYFICLLNLSFTHVQTNFSFTFSAFRLRKIRTLTSKHFSAKRTLTLLYYFLKLKQRGYKASWMRALAQTDFKSTLKFDLKSFTGI